MLLFYSVTGWRVDLHEPQALVRKLVTFVGAMLISAHAAAAHQAGLINPIAHPATVIILQGFSKSCLRVFQVDVLTVEIEHVDVDALESAASQFKVDVEPTPHTLRLIQVC